MSNKFYLQDSRTFVGNDVMWWAKDGKGYTTDLRNAQAYSQEDAQRQHNCRETDIPWPKDYIDARTRPAVDMQYINRDEALAGTGIIMKQPEQPRKEVIKCAGCGQFMSERQLWIGECQKCGADNRP